MNTLSLSIVIPVYSGSEYLTELTSEIDKVKNQYLQNKYPIQLIETIFVNDSARDDSAEVLEILKKKFSWIRVIELSRNFGQHPATMAGILHAAGDWIVTIDEDLQHHPKHIIKLLKVAILENKDIVYANPKKAVHDSALRDFGSKGIKWFIAKLTSNPNIMLFNSYRLIRGDVARGAASISMNQTYFDVALSWFSTRVTSVKMHMKDERYLKSKKSGYSFRSLLSHSLRMVQTSNLKMMRFGALLGFLSLLIAAFFSIHTLVAKIYFPETIGVEGWASIMVSVLFLGGINALIAGIILENLSVILMRNHGKPLFFTVDRSSDSILKEFFSAVNI